MVVFINGGHGFPHDGAAGAVDCLVHVGSILNYTGIELGCVGSRVLINNRHIFAEIPPHL